MLDAGEDPQVLLDAGSEAMALVGARYNAGVLFARAIIAGDMMKQIGALVKAQVAPGRRRPCAGRGVIGTVSATSTTSAKKVVAYAGSQQLRGP
jgi:methanogenic corrinoid protein MtbC1